MVVKGLRRRSFQCEDRQMEDYAAAYRAYLTQRTLPGPDPCLRTVEIRRLQEELESSEFSRAHR